MSESTGTQDALSLWTLEEIGRVVSESGDRYHSFLGVPVIARGLLQGVLVIQTVEPRTFGSQDVRMLAAAATQVAPILFDARREQRLGDGAGGGAAGEGRTARNPGRRCRP